jgi:hypothetical protein
MPHDKLSWPSIVAMADPPLLELDPPSSATHSQRAAKGKAHDKSPDPPALPPALSKAKKRCAVMPESESDNVNLFGAGDDDGGADGDEDTPRKSGQVSKVPCVAVEHPSPPCKMRKVFHTAIDDV